MKPTDFPEKTTVLQKPRSMTDEECGTLAIHFDGRACISRWRPNWRERLAVLFGAPVWLGVVGNRTQPPVWLEARRTFHPVSLWLAFRRAFWWTPRAIVAHFWARMTGVNEPGPEKTRTDPKPD